MTETSTNAEIAMQSVPHELRRSPEHDERTNIVSVHLPSPISKSFLVSSFRAPTEESARTRPKIMTENHKIALIALCAEKAEVLSRIAHPFTAKRQLTDIPVNAELQTLPPKCLTRPNVCFRSSSGRSARAATVQFVESLMCRKKYEAVEA